MPTKKLLINSVIGRPASDWESCRLWGGGWVRKLKEVLYLGHQVCGSKECSDSILFWKYFFRRDAAMRLIWLRSLRYPQYSLHCLTISGSVYAPSCDKPVICRRCTMCTTFDQFRYPINKIEKLEGISFQHGAFYRERCSVGKWRGDTTGRQRSVVQAYLLLIELEHGTIE